MSSEFDRVGFWTRFTSKSTDLCDQILCGEVAEAYYEITQLLGTFGCPYVCEITCDDSDAILIFTPESDSKVAKEIDEFMLLAPQLPNWIIYSRRQRKPIEDVFEILNEIYGVDSRDAMFTVSSANDRFNVMMHTSVEPEMTPKEAAGFVKMFMEHALGEETAMTRIGHSSITSTHSQAALTPQNFIDLILSE